MLQHRQIYNVGNDYTIFGETIIYGDIHDASNSYYDRSSHDKKFSHIMNFNIIDAFSTSTSASFNISILGNDVENNSRYILSKQYIIKYDINNGFYSCYDRMNNQHIAELIKKPTNNSIISLSCASLLSDEMFFFNYKDDLNIHAVLIFNNKAVISISLMLDYKHCGFQEKSQGKIVSMQCHPKKQYIFIVYSSGAVQVWSYSQVYQFLKLKLTSDEEKDTENFGDTNVFDETAAVTETNVPVQSSNLAASKACQLLKGVAYFMIPTPRQLLSLHPDLEVDKHIFASSFQLDACGRFAGIVWNEKVLCIYDISPLLIAEVLQKPQNQQRGTSVVSTPNNAIQLSIFGAFPCHTVGSENNGMIQYKFGSITFHPILPIVLLIVHRVRQVQYNVISLPPLVYSISLQAYQHILNCIGSYNIGDDINPNLLLKSKDNSINWYPSCMKCTPFTGLLLMAFNTVAVSMSENREDNNYVHSTNFIVVYGLSPQWIRSIGFTSCHYPIMSTLSISPDVYLYGEGVLSSRATFAENQKDVNKENNRVKFFSLIEKSFGASESKQKEQVSDCYPLLLALRTGYDRSVDFSLNTIAVSYHIFRVHWVCPCSTAFRLKGGKNNKGAVDINSGGPSKTPTSHVGYLQASLTSTIIDESKLKSQSWLVLRNEDYFILNREFGSFTLESNDGIYSFHPINFVTTEAIGISSLQSNVVNDQILSLSQPSADSSQQLVWNAILFGVVRLTLASVDDSNVGETNDINSKVDSKGKRCVCFIMYNENTLEFSSAYSNYRSATYIMPSCKPLSNNGNVSILVLTSSGTRLKLLSRQNTFSVYQELNSWNLSIEMELLWASPVGIKLYTITSLCRYSFSNNILIGAPNSVLFVSSDTKSSSHILYITKSSPESDGLFNVALGTLSTPKIEMHQFHSLHLLPNEIVLDVVWQPMPSQLQSTATADSELQRLQEVWLLNNAESSIGLRTNKRVIICTYQLKVLNDLFYNKASIIRDAVLSIAWIGGTLSYTLESGSVHYLLPSSFMLNSINNVEDGFNTIESSVIQRTLGIRKNNSEENYSNSNIGTNSMHRFDSTRGIFCSLPRNISTTLPLSGVVTAVLPDRMLIAYLRMDVYSFPQLVFAQRPCNPVEPLILGLTSIKNFQCNNHLISANEEDGIYRQDTIYSLLDFYGGPLNTALCSTRLAVALAQYQSNSELSTANKGTNKKSVSKTQLSIAVASVVGLNTTQISSSSNADDHIVRWIPLGFKFFVGSRSKLLKSSVLCLLSVRPELQELVLDITAYGGSYLPHRKSALAKQYFSAALILFMARKHLHTTEQIDQNSALILRLLDISGSYAALSAFILYQNNPLIHDAKVTESLTKISEELFLIDKAAYLALRQLTNCVSDASDTLASIFVDSLSMASLGNSQRKNSLISSAAIQIYDVSLAAPSSSSEPRINILDLQHKDRYNKSSYGPLLVHSPLAALNGTMLSVMGMRCTGLLAMDILEEYMGINLHLETEKYVYQVQEDKAESNIIGGTTSTSTDLYMGFPLPLSWVHLDLTQSSKEHERVVGYWRFSDVAYSNEEGFCNSSLKPSGARLVFLDLSRFVGPCLELYCEPFESMPSMRVEYTSSPVDPGEKHENVKCLCDVVYDNQNESKNYVSSLMSRGLRCPILRGSNLDLGLYHEDQQRTKLTIEIYVLFDNIHYQPTKGKNHILISRNLSVADDDAATQLWMLFVTDNGTVSFSFPNTNNPILESTTNIKLTQNFSEMENNSLRWTHIALTIDSSKSNVSNVDGMLSSSPVRISLTVQSETQETKMTPPTVMESYLSSQIDGNMLHIGPNLCAGWRITELRMWADVKSIDDLESQSENYLVLATKRKRLQLRIKGTKKLFGSFRDIVIPSVSCSFLKTFDLTLRTTTVDEIVSSSITNSFNNLTPAKTLFITPVTPIVDKKTSTVLDFAHFENNNSTPSAAMNARQRRLSLIKNKSSTIDCTLSDSNSNVVGTPVNTITTTTTKNSNNVDSEVVRSVKPIASQSQVSYVIPNYTKYKTSLISELGCKATMKDIMIYRTAKALSTNADAWLQCSSSKGMDFFNIGKDPALDCFSNKVKSDSLFNDTESAIFVSISKSSFKLASLAKKEISVYKINIDDNSSKCDIQLIAQVSIASTTLVHWIFISIDIILLVTSTGGYTLRISVPINQGNNNSETSEIFHPKPVKIFERIDFFPNNTSQDRIVTEVTVFQDGWTLVNSKSNVLNNMNLISLYHAKSSKAINFIALGGSFRTGIRQQPQVLILTTETVKSENNNIIVVTDAVSEGLFLVAIDLEDIHQYWKINAETIPQHKNWISPLSLFDLPATSLTIQWSIKLPAFQIEKSITATVHHPFAYFWNLRNSFYMLTSTGMLSQFHLIVDHVNGMFTCVGSSPVLSISQLRNVDKVIDFADNEINIMFDTFIVCASVSLDMITDPEQPSIRIVVAPSGNIYDISLKAFSKHIGNSTTTNS